MSTVWYRVTDPQSRIPKTANLFAYLSDKDDAKHVAAALVDEIRWLTGTIIEAWVED